MISDIHFNVKTHGDSMKTRKQYTIRFPPDASKVLEEMAEEEDVSAAELIRRAVNFYDLKLEVKRNSKRIVLESVGVDGTSIIRELVMV